MEFSVISLQFNVCFSLSFDDHGALVGPPWYDLFPTFSWLCFRYCFVADFLK